MHTERFDVIVVGGGQAGLSVGYHLSRLGVRFVILDAAERVGDAWRNRWDSLRLFTPAKYDGLAGMPFPAAPDYFPTKDEMADYLGEYARRFALPIRSGVRVDGLSRSGSSYVVTAGPLRFEAAHVIVAMATYQVPKVPPFSADLSADIRQLHSRDYRGPAQLRDGDVLLVGAGNSGSEIAIELAKSRRVWMSGRDTGHVPFRIEGRFAKVFAPILFRVVFHRILTTRTPMGRAARKKVLTQGGPLIRVKPRDLEAAGVVRVPRVAGTRDGQPLLVDGRALPVTNVIWCTGFHGGFDWIDVPVVDAAGEPLHDRGVARGEPGLYFVGLHFLYAFSSTMIHGVARDAEHVARTIGTRLAAPSALLERGAIPAAESGAR